MNESIMHSEKRNIYLGFIRDDLDSINVSFSELSDDFEVIFDSLWIKILGCVICLLMVTFNNACCILVCLFEKYGGDPMKRSLKNQIMVQIWYTGIVSNNICSPLITGKSLSEALLFAEHGENMLCTKIVLNIRNNFCTQHVLPGFELGIFMY